MCQIRILHVVGMMNYGGTENMIMNLYRNIDRNKIQFDFIVHTDMECAFDDEIRRMGGRIYRFQPFNHRGIISTIVQWVNFFKRHQEYKILHTHIRSYASLYIPIAKRFGLITIAHSHSISNGKGFKSIVKNILQYPIRYEADYLMACSNEAGAWLFGKDSVTKTNYRIVPNAIDAFKFRYDEDIRNKVRRQLQIDNKVVIGHVGRFSRVKNHTFLLECFEKFHINNINSILLLVGDGLLKESIKAYARKLLIENDVIFVDSTNDVASFMQAMDIFVFPSLWEGFGMALVEAQASGLPCISSDRVPNSTDIGANLIKYISLDEGAESWAASIRDSINIKRLDVSRFVAESGYDISECAINMAKFYLNL